MRRFMVRHAKSGLRILFKYDSSGVLRILEFEGDWNAELVQKIIGRIPTNLETILGDIASQDFSKPWIFTEVTEVSFEAFYNAYPRKVGPKELTEKKWKKLSEADQLSAILYIEDLKMLKQDGTAFPYPATYLNQKYWK